MDYLAPDTAEEIIKAMALLETWLADAGISPRGASDPGDCSAGEGIREIPAPGLERNKRGTVILKPQNALEAYGKMLRFYAAKTLALFFESRGDLDFDSFAALMGSPDPDKRVRGWVNNGGQIVPAFRIDALRKDIREGTVNSWEKIHGVYEQWFAEYPLDKARHAWAVFARLKKTAGNGGGKNPCSGGGAVPDKAAFKEELEAAMETRKWITKQVYITRAKDFTDPFRIITYRNPEEMEKVAGKLENNPFIKLAREEERRFEERVNKVIRRL
jgi:hypothetical protein